MVLQHTPTPAPPTTTMVASLRRQRPARHERSVPLLARDVLCRYPRPVREALAPMLEGYAGMLVAEAFRASGGAPLDREHIRIAVAAAAASLHGNGVEEACFNRGVLDVAQIMLSGDSVPETQPFSVAGPRLVVPATAPDFVPASSLVEEDYVPATPPSPLLSCRSSSASDSDPCYCGCTCPSCSA